MAQIPGRTMLTDDEIAARAAEVRRLGRALEVQTPAVASSLDGVTFTFTAPVAGTVQAGGYVTIDTPTGSGLGQIRELGIDRDGRGPEIQLSAGDVGNVLGQIPFDRLAGRGVMLTPSEPFHDATFTAASSDAVRRWFLEAKPGRATIRVGEATLSTGVDVDLDAAGFARHTFLCGQSGSGKSYTMGLILEQLLLHTTLPIVVLDPNSDATRLRELRPDTDPEASERWAAITPRIAVRGVGRAAEERLQLRFFDLELATQQALLGLDPLRDREEFDALRQAVEEVAAGRSVTELERSLYEDPDPQRRALALRIRNLGVLQWPVWSRDSGGVLADLDRRDWRCLVVDLGTIALPATRALVAAAVLSRLWERRAERRPVLVVIDEAHNVCPPRPEDRLTTIATDLAVAIAAEGRKFGLYLLVATQRPLKVHDNVLSQCDNLMLMRVNSQGDLARIAELFSFVPAALLARATTFGLGHLLVCGRVASHPTFVRSGGRIAQEGGADVPAEWANGG